MGTRTLTGNFYDDLIFAFDMITLKSQYIYYAEIISTILIVIHYCLLLENLKIAKK